MRANRPLRVLFVCTGNSARSQIAEALLNHKGAGRFIAESAGSRPAARVNPYAVDVLKAYGVDWPGRTPRGVQGLEREPWDIVITVCDRAKESCPVFLGHPVVAHWGLPDPAEVEGEDTTKRAAFRDTLREIDRRLDRLLTLSVEQMEPEALAAAVQAIGSAGSQS